MIGRGRFLSMLIVAPIGAMMITGKLETKKPKMDENKLSHRVCGADRDGNILFDVSNGYTSGDITITNNANSAITWVHI